MPYFIIIIPGCVALLFFLLKGRKDDSLKSTLTIFAIFFVSTFILWLFLPSYIFDLQQEKYVNEILNKTGIPPTIAKVIASILAVAYVSIIWFGKWRLKPMNFVYSFAVPPIIFLLMQIMYPNTSKGCIAINPNTGKYEFCECDYPDSTHPTWHTRIIKNVRILIPIKGDKNTVLIDGDGNGRYFYTQDENGNIELFDQDGYTPTGDKTNRVTKEIAKEYKKQINSGKSNQTTNQNNTQLENQKNKEIVDPNLNYRNSKKVQLLENKISENKSNLLSTPTPKNSAIDYLITTQNSHEINGILTAIKNAFELNGTSSQISETSHVSLSSLRGQFKRYISVTSSLNNQKSSIDENTLSTSYSYTINIYDVKTEKLIKTTSDKILTIGFSESENAEKIKDLFVLKIKSLL